MLGALKDEGGYQENTHRWIASLAERRFCCQRWWHVDINMWAVSRTLWAVRPGMESSAWQAPTALKREEEVLDADSRRWEWLRAAWSSRYLFWPVKSVAIREPFSEERGVWGACFSALDLSDPEFIPGRRLTGRHEPTAL